MNNTQLQQTIRRLYSIVALSGLFIFCNPLYAQSEGEYREYRDGGQILFGTSASRLSATVHETDAGVTMQVIGVGPMIFDGLDFSFFINPSALVWSDKTFTESLPHNSANALFSQHIALSSSLKSGGLNFSLSLNSCRYRQAGLKPPITDPTSILYSDVPGMDALILSMTEPNQGKFYEIPSGEIRVLLTCYFKKVVEGVSLQSSDLGIGVKTDLLDGGGLFFPRWLHNGVPVGYDDGGLLQQYIAPQQFPYRSPSTVSIVQASDFTPVTAVVKGVFERGNERLLSNALLDGWQNRGAELLRHSGRLTWDNITQYGFIYIDNTSVTLSVDEYTNTLLVDGVAYPFPDASEFSLGEFERGDYLFKIVYDANSNMSGSVDYLFELEGLTPSTLYSVWPFIGYTFASSREYFTLGLPLEPFLTEKDCSAVSAPVSFDQSFCSGAKVSDLKVSVEEGSTLEWYTSADQTSSPLAMESELVNGIYYARAVTSVITSCYSDSVAVHVTLDTGLGSPAASTPQRFCTGSKVSDLQVDGSHIQWYKGGFLLSADAPLSDGIYSAYQSSASCRSAEPTDVLVKIVEIIPDAPSISSPQKFCGASTLLDIATDGSSVNWYDASGRRIIALTTPLVYGSTYYAAQTLGSCESLTRTAVLVEENEPSSPDFSDIVIPSSFCQGSTLSDIPVPNNQIVWYSAPEGGFLLEGSTVLADGVTYYAAQRGGSCESSVRTAVPVSLGASVSPSGPSQQRFCVSATLSDLSVSGAHIQWYNQPSGGNALELTSPLVSGSYYATQGLGSCQSERLAIEVIILESGLSAPVVKNPQTFCNGAVVGNLQAMGSNIKWYDAEGHLLSSEKPLVAGLYYATQSTELCESSYRSEVKVVIQDDILFTPDVTSPQQMCSPATVADITHNDASQVILWYASPDDITPLGANERLTDGAIYYGRLQAGNCSSSLFSTVEIELTGANVRPSAPNFGDNSHQTFCPGAIVSDIWVPNTRIVLYSSLYGSALLNPSDLLPEGETVYYAAQVAGSCESAVRTAVTVTVGMNGLPAPEADAIQLVCSASGTVQNLSVTLRTTGSQAIWYTGETGSQLANQLTNGATYYVSERIGGCESTTRTAVQVFVNPTISITTQPVSNAYLCSGESAELTVSAASNAALEYRWFETGAPTGETTSSITVSQAGTYTVEVSNACYRELSQSCVVHEQLNLIEQKRNHTLAVNNNPSQNGGNTFVEYKWYRNGQVIQPRQAGGSGKGGYYYAGEGRELDMQAEYHAEMWDASGRYYITCPFTPTRHVEGSISVYPNPLVSSQTVYVDANLESGELENATIDIYSPLGSCIGHVNAQRLTPVRLPEERGVYILKFSSQEREENFKIIVK